MTARERLEERIDSICPWDNPGLRAALLEEIEQAITAAVEEKELTITRDLNRQMAEIQDAAIARITELEAENAKLEATLEIFEDGANWERYPGLSDKSEYVWRHDSDPRVLAQDACNKPDGGTK